eukprot:IDg12947t1
MPMFSARNFSVALSRIFVRIKASSALHDVGMYAFLGRLLRSDLPSTSFFQVHDELKLKFVAAKAIAKAYKSKNNSCMVTFPVTPPSLPIYHFTIVRARYTLLPEVPFALCAHLSFDSMWYLLEDSPLPADSPPPKYWLGGVNSGGRLIGRKNVHIRIKAPSVSRTHATVRVVPASYYTLSQGAPPHRRSTAVVVEDSSAYGTYVKYPPGHASNRTGDAEGHHCRLDKNVSTEVHEGALLAFGAPTSWWRVCWHNVLCFASKLTEQHNESLAAVAKASGLQVASDISANITHFVTEQYRTTSMKFLSALIRDMRIVTPAWTSSVHHTVQEACKLITEAKSNAAGLAACKLADEQHFMPSFSEEDKLKFPSDVLESTFTEHSKTKRGEVFLNLSFGFPKEEFRSKWAPILEQMGAHALLSTSVKAKKNNGVIHISMGESPKRKRSNSALDNSKEKLTERSLIASILSGDSSHIVIAIPKSATTEKSERGSIIQEADEATDAEDDVINV